MMWSSGGGDDESRPNGHQSSTARGPLTPTEAERELAAYFKYPSLGRLFDEADRAALSRLRSRLRQAANEFERVVRRGTREEATRAAAVAQAIASTLDLFDELERLQNENSSGR